MNVNHLPTPADPVVTGRGGRCAEISTAQTIARICRPGQARVTCGHRFALAALAICLLLPGCGYLVGSPYSAEIRSVYVPIFESASNRRGLEFQLTEAVQKQIQMRTPFRLVLEPEADTRLKGRLVSAEKSVLGVNGLSDARELQLNLVVEVTWEDLRTGKILAQQRVPISPDVIVQTSQASFAPEVGQSLATANQQAVDSLARNIVDMMESPW